MLSGLEFSWAENVCMSDTTPESISSLLNTWEEHFNLWWNGVSERCCPRYRGNKIRWKIHSFESRVWSIACKLFIPSLKVKTAWKSQDLIPLIWGLCKQQHNANPSSQWAWPLWFLQGLLSLSFKCVVFQVLLFLSSLLQSLLIQMVARVPNLYSLLPMHTCLEGALPSSLCLNASQYSLADTQEINPNKTVFFFQTSETRTLACMCVSLNTLSHVFTAQRVKSSRVWRF